MSFHVGQRVVCIDDAPRPRSVSYSGRVPIITKGTIYTVRGVYNAPPSPSIGVYLEEVTGEYSQRHKIEIGYCATRFRPVRETNIDVFTKMLEKEPVGV